MFAESSYVMPIHKQLPLKLPAWGGKRRGAGRKRTSPRPNVPHATRPEHNKNHPIHITLRLAPNLPTLRENKRYSLIHQAFIAMKRNEHFRLLHFSVQSNHLHLLAEATNKSALTRAIKGLQIRIAKALNKHLARKGQIFPDRYHARALATPREVRHAFAYVLLNARKHAHERNQLSRAITAFDPCSSAEYFDGWRNHAQRNSSNAEAPIKPPATWLARTGWRRHGLVSPTEIPAAN